MEPKLTPSQDASSRFDGDHVLSNYQRRKLKREGAPLPPRGGTPTIWNVWDGDRLLGIVNESTWTWASNIALRTWPDRPSLRVVEAARDPFRLRTKVRPEMLLPLVTQETIH